LTPANCLPIINREDTSFQAQTSKHIQGCILTETTMKQNHAQTFAAQPANLGRLCGLIAIAWSGCAAAQSVGPQVTLFGNVDGGFYHRRLAGETSVNRVDGGLMSVSRWGLRGTEDLGGGLAAEFNLTSHFRLDTGETGRHPGDTAANRVFTLASWVGLRGGFGSIRLGRIPSGTFVNTLQFSPLADSTGLGPFMMHTYVTGQAILAAHGTSDGPWNNSVAYTTPVLSGFTGALQYAPSEGGTDGRREDVTLNYRNKEFAAAISRLKIDQAAYTAPRTVTDPAGVPYVIEKEDNTLASVSYDFTVAKVFAQYATAKLQPRGLSSIDLHTVGLSAQVPVGAGRFVASWARTKREQASVTDRSRNTVSTGYIYNLSKRTDVYGFVINDRATGVTSGTGAAVGVRHYF
jgi:predicted porin